MTNNATQELIPGKLEGTYMGEILSMPTLCIIHAYMLRQDELDEDSLKKELEFILSKATSLIDGMLNVAQQMNKKFEIRGSLKQRLSAKTANMIIAFSQNFVQAMWQDHDDFI